MGRIIAPDHREPDAAVRLLGLLTALQELTQPEPLPKAWCLTITTHSPNKQVVATVVPMERGPIVFYQDGSALIPDWEPWEHLKGERNIWQRGLDCVEVFTGAILAELAAKFHLRKREYHRMRGLNEDGTVPAATQTPGA